MVPILMISATLVTLGLRIVKVFWNKGSDAIIFFHDVNKIFSSHDSNYIVDGIMYPTFGNKLS